MFPAQVIAWAFSLDLPRAGSKRAARIAIMAITTNISMRVKPHSVGAVTPNEPPQGCSPKDLLFANRLGAPASLPGGLVHGRLAGRDAGAPRQCDSYSMAQRNGF